MDDGNANNLQVSYFVGIAASAGGLEAASLLVHNLPRDADAVYILAQHMSPTHKSLLSSLISRETKLPVVELDGEAIPEPNTIYVTPPNRDVVVEGGKLILREPEGHSATPKPSADRLLKSLAAEQGEKCVAIVLSGTGSDGSYGVQAVREAGGITIAQDTTSAKYDGMPSSAIETGCIDLTLTPEQIGQHLEKILASPRNFEDLRHINDTPTRLSDLFQILLAKTKIDYRDYKENTINRRIARRMVALGIDKYEDYVDFCRKSEDEVDALNRDLLISVTRFFRDRQQFDQLAVAIREVIKDAGGNVRIWVAGCATGEEAYSIAILVAEAMGGAENFNASTVQIFASDIDDRALGIARRGIYPVTAIDDIPEELREKYFTIHGNMLHVSPAIRNVVLFSRHNIAQDPPFINVDLVSLRNVLIYFNSALQTKVLSRVHYALNSMGALFLGTSESVGGMDDFFEARAGSEKIFRKRKMKHASIATATDFYTSPSARPTQAKPEQMRDDSRSEKMFDSLARVVARDGFIATTSNDIIRVYGDISEIIELSEGSSLRMNVRLLREGLRDEAGSLIVVALRNKETRAGRWYDISGRDFDKVRMVAYPIMDSGLGEDHVLMSVEKKREDLSSPMLDDLTDDERLKYVREIEQDMISTRETLQQTVEELQTSNEELQSVNEELQSTNEELQATNEELETSNEELQSTNEELITVNEEMQINSVELQKVTMELTAVLEHSPHPVLVIDNALIIRRVSRSAVKFFNLDGMTGVGMHVAQCAPPEGFPTLPAICNDALKLHETKTLQVTAEDMRYALTISPVSDTLENPLGLNLSVVEIPKA